MCLQTKDSATLNTLVESKHSFNTVKALTFLYIRQLR